MTIRLNGVSFTGKRFFCECMSREKLRNWLLPHPSVDARVIFEGRVKIIIRYDKLTLKRNPRALFGCLGGGVKSSVITSPTRNQDKK